MKHEVIFKAGCPHVGTDYFSNAFRLVIEESKYTITIGIKLEFHHF